MAAATLTIYRRGILAAYFALHDQAPGTSGEKQHEKQTDEKDDSEDFVRTVRELHVTPHITKNDKNRTSNLTAEPRDSVDMRSIWPPLADRKRLW